MSNSIIKLSDEHVEKYKVALEKAKKAFFVMTSVVFFKFVLKNKFLLAIYFLIYSVIVIALLKDMYFVLYENRKAIKQLWTAPCQVDSGNNKNNLSSQNPEFNRTEAV